MRLDIEIAANFVDETMDILENLEFADFVLENLHLKEKFLELERPAGK